MTKLIALLCLLALPGLGLLALRWIDTHDARRKVHTFDLRFPRQLDADAVVACLAGLSAIRSPWYWRWLHTPMVRFEVRAEHGRIKHYLVVPAPLVGVVLTHVRAAVPGVRLDEQPPLSPVELTTALELGLSTHRRALRTDSLNFVSAAVLSGLQPLGPHEAAVMQWLVTPALIPRPPRQAGTPRHSPTSLLALDTDGYELLPHAEALQAERVKQAEPLFRAIGRVGVRAASPARAQFLLNRTLAGYHLLNAPGVQLHRRWLVASPWALRRLRRAVVPVVVWPALFNAAELAGVLALPIGVAQLPGLDLASTRQLPPDVAVPSTGCVIGRATYPGSERLVAIPPADRLLHLLCTGPTGVGKSNLLLSLISIDMNAGRSCVVVDPKGDLVAECLKRVPASRVRDVIVLDPADDDRPVGFDLLGSDPGSAELVAEQVVFIFHQLFAAFWGPRTDDILRASLLTLMRDPDMTLVELPLLLNSPAFRSRFVAAVSDDVVGLAPFWSWYDSMSNAERAQVIAPLMNKLRATLLRSRLRHCVGQSQPGLRLEAVLNENKLLFVPLRKGLLGDEAAALIGSLFIARVWQAVQARTGLPEPDRRQTHLYIDEVQDYLKLPTSVGDMLAQARGLKLGITAAHQHLGQLPTELRRDLLANCRSKVIFQTDADDGRAFAKELTPYLKAEDFQGLGRYEIVASLAAGQRVAPPLTAVTLPPPPETHRAQAAVAWSRQHYGRDRRDIDAAMRARHSVQTPPAAVGRQVRKSQ